MFQDKNENVNFVPSRMSWYLVSLLTRTPAWSRVPKYIHSFLLSELQKYPLNTRITENEAGKNYTKLL